MSDEQKAVFGSSVLDVQGEGENLVLPLVPLRNLVIFPNTLTPLFIGREASLEAVYHATASDKKIFITSQMNPTNEVDLDKIYKIGVVANILHVSRSNDENARILVDSLHRAKIKQIYKETTVDNKSYYCVSYDIISDEQDQENAQLTALQNSIIKAMKEYHALSGKNEEAINTVQNLKNPSHFAYNIYSILPIDLKKKQKLLEESSLKKGLMQAYKYFLYEIEALESEKKIQEEVRKRITKNQKEYYLNEQIKTAQEEIRKLNPDKDNTDFGKYTRMLKKITLPKDAKEKVSEEINRLSSHSSSVDTAITKAYLDFVFALPWNTKDVPNKDISKAEQVLNTNHSGLEKIKERIIEYIAIQSRNDKPKGSVLCFYGPPGVGKTSLVRSVAEAMGKKFVKISLGGLRDEAEIRGHRKTYVGAFAGKILLALKKSKVNNPVILLDEIDKIGSSYRGDPYSALLEVLDPEQNKEFNDHYLEVPFDLSNVTFIATANSLDMPRPLRDRMEIIRITGYSDIEKIKIFEEHLWNEVLEEHSLTKDEIDISISSVKDIITYYTRESGVRDLKRNLSRICRKVLTSLAKNQGEVVKITINPEDLKHYLGTRIYKYGKSEEKDEIGVVMGLAYTETGGDVLTIEAVKSSGGKGEIKMTGKLGEVMKESIQTAFSYLESSAAQYKIDRDELMTHNIHMHFPEGAVPKDGPSAGIAITTALVSLFAGKPVYKDIAMTGEVTLHGRVLGIGGLKEKLMSACRSGIRRVFIPKDNEKDLEDIPKEIINSLEITPIENVKQVLEKSIAWD